MRSLYFYYALKVFKSYEPIIIMEELPVVETYTGYSEVLTANQKDKLDRQKRIEELLIVLTNNIEVMRNDIESVKAHLELVTNEESL